MERFARAFHGAAGDQTVGTGLGRGGPDHDLSAWPPRRVPSVERRTGPLVRSRVGEGAQAHGPAHGIGDRTAAADRAGRADCRGKSEIGLRLARSLETDLLTADSRQVYRGMDIATDKPSMEQRQGVPHRLSTWSIPDERFNAGQYRELAVQEIERLYHERRVPLVVGERASTCER